MILCFLGMAWAVMILAEAIEPVAYGIMDRIDHVIGYGVKE
jgi:hypothetical protein